MAFTWSDALQESETRAVNAVFSSLGNEMAVQGAIARAGGAKNVTGSNLNPDAAAGVTLRLDRVNIGDGVLR